MIDPNPEIVAKINSMSHFEMAYNYRFCSFGHMYFDSNLPYYEIFMKRFREFGGMTTSISKQIGWGENG